MSGCPKQILPDWETPEERVARLLDEFGTALDQNIHASTEPFLNLCFSREEREQFLEGAPMVVALVSDTKVARRHVPQLSAEEQASFPQKVADQIFGIEQLADAGWIQSLIF